MNLNPFYLGSWQLRITIGYIPYRVRIIRNYTVCVACLYLHTFLTHFKPPVNGEWIVHVGGCLTWCVTSLIIFPYQLAQARPHNVLHFLVYLNLYR